MNERAHLLRKYVDELKQQNALLSSKKTTNLQVEEETIWPTQPPQQEEKTI